MTATEGAAVAVVYSFILFYESIKVKDIPRILLIVGILMDLTPSILIFTLIFLPTAKNFGMDPMQFGIMLIFNLCIGNITPLV